jgi:hypothetical protein
MPEHPSREPALTAVQDRQFAGSPATRTLSALTTGVDSFGADSGPIARAGSASSG